MNNHGGSGLVRSFARHACSGVAVMMMAISGPVFGTGTERTAEALVFNCFTCHGTDGRSPGEMHSINGKSSEFVQRKMKAYKQDRGDPTIMNRIAKGYTDEEIALIADYIAGLK